MSGVGDDRNGGQDIARGLSRALRPLVLMVALLALLTALPWAGIGYCIATGHPACPAMLSPQYSRFAEGPDTVQRPGPASRPAPTVSDRGTTPTASLPLPPATPGNRPGANPAYVALVIGNTNYAGENRLQNPGRDATAIAETLKDLNYTVIGGKALLDLNRQPMLEALADFGRRATGATVALVYYAGHGIQIDEKEPIYLIPLDARLQQKSLLPDEGIALSRVLNFLPSGPEQFGLVILDACRTSRYPLEGLSSGTRGTGLRGLKQVRAPNRAFVAFSASAGEEAADGKDQPNSPYATALLKRLQDPDRPDIKTVFARVQDDFRGGSADQNPGHDDRLGDRKIRLAAASAEPLPAPGSEFRDCPDCPVMRVVPKGQFRMGAPATEEGSEDNERPQHQVTIPRDIAIGKFELTFAEWDACVAGGGCRAHKPDDRGWGRGKRPVINVNWDDAQDYVAWLSNRTLKTYRLLSEAEWEYAARAGTTTAYSFGPTISDKQANFGGRVGKTTPVGSFPANDFGLHDMHGNMWEWTQDCWNDTYQGAPADGRPWTTGDCSRRVLRGGSWDYIPRDLRSASRGWNNPSYRGNIIGFRVARTN